MSNDGEGEGLSEYNIGTSDPDTIDQFQKMFGYFWERGAPFTSNAELKGLTMTTKTDYTNEEWLEIMKTPIYAGFYVMFADPSFTGMIKEMKVMGEVIQQADPPGHAKDLVSDIAADFEQMSQEKESFQQDQRPESADQETATGIILQKVSSGVKIVAEKAGSMELLAFKQWLIEVATVVAAAAKEGGFLGIGGQFVSEREEAALEEISDLLEL